MLRSNKKYRYAERKRRCSSPGCGCYAVPGKRLCWTCMRGVARRGAQATSRELA